MARVVLVQPDEWTRRRLAEQLFRHGCTVESFERLDDARAAIPRADLVLADAGAAPAEAIAAVMGAAEARRRAVWTGPPSARPERLSEVGVADFLELPASTARLRAVVERVPPRDRGWAGREFLDAVDGPLERFPPARVLFLAHCVEATGRLEVSAPDGGFSVDLRDGVVVGCRGVVELLDTLPVPCTPDDEFAEAVGRAVQAGFRPDEALAAAAVGIGRRLARLVGATGGRVRFDPTAPAPRPELPLPEPVPRIVALGLARERPAPRVRADLARLRAHRPLVRIPVDAAPGRWGIPARALRLLRRANRADTLAALLGEGGADEDRAALDLLVQLGLIELEAPPREGAAEAAHDDAGAAGAGAAVGGPGPEEPEDPRVAEMRAEVERLRQLGPAEVIGIASSSQANRGAVTRLAMERAARFHPDRYADAPAAVQELAAEAFDLVNRAREALLRPGVLEELEERLAAEEEGRPWASRADRSRAQLVARRAEMARRRRDWREAHSLFRGAAELDPTEWRYRFEALVTGHRAGELSGEDAVAGLDELAPARPSERAEVAFAAGEILLREGDEEGAYARFERAVQLDPEHVGARRYLRLREMRRARSQDRSQGAAAALLRLLRRRDGEG